MRVVPFSTRQAHKALAVDANDTNDDTCSAYYCENEAPTKSRRRGCQRWLYAYPRLCFVLVLLACAFGTGAYAAYHLALLLLEVVGARHALATARTQLVATEITLRTATACALRQVFPRVLEAKTRIAAAAAPWRARVDAFDTLVTQARANFSRCASQELDRLERLVDLNASTTAEQFQCLAHAIEATVAQYPSAPSSQVIKRVQQILTASQDARDAAASEKASETPPSLASLVQNASHSILSAVDTWLDELETFVASELDGIGAALRLPKLPVVDGLAELLGFASGGLADGDSPFSLISKDQLVAALCGIAGINRDLSRAVSQLATTWQDLHSIVSRIQDHEAAVREELKQIRNATQQRVEHSLNAFRQATARLKDAVAATTRSSLDALVSAVANALDLDPSEQLERVLARRQNDLIPTEYEPNASPTIERVKLTVSFAAVENVTTSNSPVDQQAKWDPWLLRAALYDASATLVTILMTWDFLSRLGWFLGKLAMLLTESYSDLQPVDIRDITTITTLIDFWGVLKCRHDLGSVVFAIMTEGSYVLETAVHFVLWVMLEIAGTLALAAWSRAFSDRCLPKNGSVDLTVTTPSTVLTYLSLLVGDPPSVELSPVVAVRRQTAPLDAAFDRDEKTWRARVRSVAETRAQQANALVLERRFLLDVRGSLLSCSIETDDDSNPLDADQCSLASLDATQSISEWEARAASVFRHHRELVRAERLVAACLAQGDGVTPESLQIVRRLDHAHGCLLDQSLYLAVASWWVLLVVVLALRLTARMAVKAAGLLFWRFLSADRLQVLAFSDERGAIQSRERLPKAIRRHLRNLRWRVAARVLGVAMGAGSVAVVAVHVLPAFMLRPFL